MATNGRNNRKTERVKYGFLPMSRLIKKALAERNMSKKAFQNLLQCSPTYASDFINGHRKPSHKYRLTIGVILGWVKRIDGSVRNDVEGVLRVHDYFEGTDCRSTAEEISEKMMAEETKKRMRKRKKIRIQQVKRTATIEAEKKAREKYGIED